MSWDWLQEPVLQRLLAGLGNARVAGGAVRNALLGVGVHEVDIATPLSPQEVMARAKEAGFSVHPTGLEHGTVTVAREHHAFEVTTLRHDVETDGRRAKVAFTDDWEADARRRDFTMNALYCAADGTIFDPVSGMADVQARHVRFVGEPQARIAEDYLRILRFFRFFAQYGQGAPDGAALAACAAMKAGLSQLSPERIRQELLKLLIAPRAVEALDAMAQAGILELLLPGARLAAFRRLAEVDAAEGFAPDAILRLFALSPSAGLKERLRLANAQAQRLEAISSAPEIILADAKAQLYRLGADVFRAAVKLQWREGSRHLHDLPEQWPVPVFPVKGQDLQGLGMAPGPAMGETLKRLEAEWIAGGFAAGKDELLARIRQGK